MGTAVNHSSPLSGLSLFWGYIYLARGKHAGEQCCAMGSSAVGSTVQSCTVPAFTSP